MEPFDGSPTGETLFQSLQQRLSRHTLRGRGYFFAGMFFLLVTIICGIVSVAFWLSEPSTAVPMIHHNLVLSHHETSSKSSSGGIVLLGTVLLMLATGMVWAIGMETLVPAMTACFFAMVLVLAVIATGSPSAHAPRQPLKPAGRAQAETRPKVFAQPLVFTTHLAFAAAQQRVKPSAQDLRQFRQDITWLTDHPLKDWDATKHDAFLSQGKAEYITRLEDSVHLAYSPIAAQYLKTQQARARAGQRSAQATLELTVVGLLITLGALGATFYNRRTFFRLEAEMGDDWAELDQSVS